MLRLTLLAPLMGLLCPLRVLASMVIPLDALRREWGKSDIRKVRSYE
ncbi:hypothetical protein KKF84_01860 [Myxococcota bacterium]|nr:hypothetical protein [Myxococcota bacterium]